MHYQEKLVTGSIQPKDGKFYAVINLYVDGKRRPKWIFTGFYVRNGKRNATAFLHRELERINREIVLTSNRINAGTLFTDFLRFWLISKKGKITNQTYNSYRHLIESRIQDYFGPLKKTINTITSIDFEIFYSKLFDDGLTSCSILHYHRMMKQALSYGVKQGIIFNNVMDKVTTPKDTTYVPAIYNKEELMNLLIRAKNSNIYLPVLLSSYYGLRRSEVLGLQWDNIDFNKGIISIKHKVLQEHHGNKKVIVGYDKLKSQSSRRTLPLIPVVKQVLMDEYANQIEHFGSVKKYVCLDSAGTLIKPSYITKKFKNLLEYNGLRKIRFHDLRHTCASLLVSNGIPMKNIQLWLGHSDFRITAKYYAHLDFSAQQQSAKAIAEILDGAV